LHPEVKDNYKIEWKEPTVEGLVDFMCSEKGFSEDRVRKSVERMLEGCKKQKAKVSLEKWFG
jgi:flap endonuclease-1